jgi:hypothetical protein
MKQSLIAILLMLTAPAYSQGVKLLEGDLKALKSEPSIRVEFTYDNMVIGDEQTPEADYKKKKKQELNGKDPGRGDKWEKSWVADREERFEPKFKELFQKYSKKKIADNSKYTLIFNTTRTEPGWVGVGLIRRSARIDGDVLIVETANRSNVIAKLAVENAPGAGGMGYDYDTGLRIQEAYAKSGKEVGRVVGKK